MHGCVRIVSAVSNINFILLSFVEIGDVQPCMWLLCISRSNVPTAARHAVWPAFALKGDRLLLAPLIYWSSWLPQCCHGTSEVLG